MHDPSKHPWVKGHLTILESVLESVFAEAKAAYARDEESCGFLAGPAADFALLDTIVPMQNRANMLHALDPETYPRTGRMYFDIHPMKFEKEIRTRAEASHPVKVLYHSHLDVGAYFSETDAAAATMGGAEPSYALAYLVTSVRGGEVDEHKLFVWDAKTNSFQESSLTVLPRR